MDKIIRYGKSEIQQEDLLAKDVVSIRESLSICIWSERSSQGKVRINLGVGDAQIVLPAMSAKELTVFGNFILGTALRIANPEVAKLQPD